MAETLSLLSVIAFVVAGVSLVLAIVLFIYFKIPVVIGDLSGKNAKKSIARMRTSNEKSGNKSYRTSEANAERGKLTSAMPSGSNNAKGKKNADRAADRTAASNQMPETGLLRENMASIKEESTVLLAGTEGTALLAETPIEPAKRVGGVTMTLLEEVMLIHTDEVIG